MTSRSRSPSPAAARRVDGREQRQRQPGAIDGELVHRQRQDGQQRHERRERGEAEAALHAEGANRPRRRGCRVMNAQHAEDHDRREQRRASARRAQRQPHLIDGDRRCGPRRSRDAPPRGAAGASRLAGCRRRAEDAYEGDHRDRVKRRVRPASVARAVTPMACRSAADRDRRRRARTAPPPRPCRSMAPHRCRSRTWRARSRTAAAGAPAHEAGSIPIIGSTTTTNSRAIRRAGDRARSGDARWTQRRDSHQRRQQQESRAGGQHRDASVPRGGQTERQREARPPRQGEPRDRPARTSTARDRARRGDGQEEQANGVGAIAAGQHDGAGDGEGACREQQEPGPATNAVAAAPSSQRPAGIAREPRESGHRRQHDDGGNRRRQLFDGDGEALERRRGCCGARAS